LLRTAGRPLVDCTDQKCGSIKRKRQKSDGIGVYICVHNEGPRMGAVRVDIREFREKLASYLLESEVPVAITRHGDTVGYYIPARRKRADSERAALKEAATRLQQVLAAERISEDEILADFTGWCACKKK